MLRAQLVSYSPGEQEGGGTCFVAGIPESGQRPVAADASAAVSVPAGGSDGARRAAVDRPAPPPIPESACRAERGPAPTLGKVRTAARFLSLQPAADRSWTAGAVPGPLPTTDLRLPAMQAEIGANRQKSMEID